MNKVGNIVFPEYSGIRCLMMPYIQGDPESVPEKYRNGYEDILEKTYIKYGDTGYLTIDESPVTAGSPHRGARSKYSRPLHTEAGIRGGDSFVWGHGWGKTTNVYLSRDVRVLLANNLDNSCALWNTEHKNTTVDGDIGAYSDLYPYENAEMMKAGDVYEIGILTPHESLIVKQDFNRQFLRIVSSGVYGRERYFTENPNLQH